MAAAAARTVLVVDDDTAIRELVAEVLRLEGYTVLEAADVPTAQQAIAAHAPPAGTLCIILLDIRLQGAAGEDVRGYAEQHSRQTPIVLMTASAEHLEAARSAGQVAIAKPFDLDVLLAAVDRACAGAEGRE